MHPRIALVPLTFALSTLATTAAAAPIVRPEFEVTRASAVDAAGRDALVACSATSCTVVWRREGGTRLVASRLGTGGPLAALPEDLVPSGRPTAFHPNGANEFILGVEASVEGSLRQRLYRLDAQTLAVLGTPVDLPAGASVRGAGARVVVVRHHADTNTVDLSQLDVNLALVDTQVAAFASCGTYCFDHLTAARGAGFVAVRSGAEFRRFAATDLTPADATAKKPNQIHVGVVGAVGFDGENFVLVWPEANGNSKKLRLARVRATDSAALDPDDTFNGFAGGIEIGAGDPYNHAPRPVRIAATATGEVTVLWADVYEASTSTVYYSHVSRVNVTGAKPSLLQNDVIGSGDVYGGTSGFSAPVIGAHVDFAWNGTYGVYAQGTHGILAYSAGPKVHGRVLTRGAAGALMPSLYHQLSKVTGTSPEAAVASDGTDFVVAWAADENLYLKRYRGHDGVDLDPTPRIVQAAKGFSVVSARRRTPGYAILLRGEGTLRLVYTDSDGVQVGFNEWYESGVTDADLACDGARCAVLFARDYQNSRCVSALRYGTSVELLGGAATVIVPCSSQHVLGSVFVAGNPGREPSLRTFMISGAAGAPYSSGWLARLRAETGSMLPNSAPTDEVPVLLASDGLRFVLGTVKSGALMLRGIDDVEGTTSTGPVTAIDVTPGVVSRPTLSFDGTSYVLAARLANAATIVAKLYSPTLQPGAAVDVATDTSGSPGARPAQVASNGYGRSLVTFQRSFAPASDPGNRVVAAFLDNDLGPGTPVPPADAGADAMDVGVDAMFDAFVSLDAKDAASDAAAGPDAATHDLDASPIDAASSADGASDSNGSATDSSIADTSLGPDVTPGDTNVGADGDDVRDTATIDATTPPTDAVAADAEGDAGEPSLVSAEDDGGCGCRIHGRNKAEATAAILGLLAAVLLRRRRTGATTRTPSGRASATVREQ